MELKKSLSSFNDRELLEIILLNQVYAERRLDRMEVYFHKISGKEAELNGVTNDYYTDPHELDGRREGFSMAENFKELMDKAYSARLSINNLLKDESSEISW